MADHHSRSFPGVTPFLTIREGRGQEALDMGGPQPPAAGVYLHLAVDDADRWAERARAAGATVLMPVADQFWGDRYGQLRDPFGHTWSVGSPIRQG